MATDADVLRRARGLTVYGGHGRAVDAFSTLDGGSCPVAGVAAASVLSAANGRNDALELAGAGLYLGVGLFAGFVNDRDDATYEELVGQDQPGRY